VQPQDDDPTQEMRAVEPESGVNMATVLVAVGVSAVVAVLIVTSGLVLILVLQTR
jgi:signal transduction histidine kinase